MFATIPKFEIELFTEGSKSVKQFILKLREDSIVLPSQDKLNINRYLDAADRFLIKSSKFIDFVTKTKELAIYNLLIGFVINYPKTKQNLANSTELLNSVINYYRMISNKQKKYDESKDGYINFIKDNSANIYDTIVVITNIIRARDIIIRYHNMNK
jgi:hypothetical protein